MESKKVQLHLELISQSPKRWKLRSVSGEFFGVIGYRTKKNFYLTDKWLNREKNIDDLLDFEKQDLKNQFYQFLSKSDKSPKQIDDWLKKRGTSSSNEIAMLNSAKELNFISEERFGEQKLKKEFRKGNKPLWRIKLELNQQGIDSDNLNLSDYHENDSLKNYIYRNLWKLHKDKEKFIKRLMMKGFSYKIIKSSIEEIENEDI